ncbi:STAS-like domain-containing protein [Aliarcobacter cryaerophilus]|uniref:STAS-like domain-containing protein n=1 Tax=Aliarcobacter cryaerophilus TaxID=28198 RepID=UPI00112F0433|nr:STAS-like domain-containing protein [Aliarcobacter cryaerophilus]
MEKIINIAKDFSDSPGARYYDDGDFSGEQFRDEFLLKYFDNYDRIIVNLDGTEGYATSFLEESFGGLARIKGKDLVLRKIEFISNEEPDLIEEIQQYIKAV